MFKEVEFPYYTRSDDDGWTREVHPVIEKQKMIDITDIISLDEYIEKEGKTNTPWSKLRVQMWEMRKLQSLLEVCLNNAPYKYRKYVPSLETTEELKQRFVDIVKVNLGEESLATLMLHPNKLLREAAKKIFEEENLKSID